MQQREARCESTTGKQSRQRRLSAAVTRETARREVASGACLSPARVEERRWFWGWFVEKQEVWARHSAGKREVWAQEEWFPWQRSPAQEQVVIAARRTIPLAPTPPSFQQSAAPTPPAFLQTIPKTTSSPQHAPVTGKRQKRLPVVLFLVSLLLIGAAGATAYLWYFRILPPAAASLPQPKIVGQISLLSSEQLSENSDRGIDDEVQIDLHGLSTPSPGKSYYAWLLGTKNQGEARAVLLGKLAVNQGNA